ncbi:nitrite reductase small subunit NirD [Deinococcus koreensis]|uniref:Nitrite reductase (NAD(P)H) small subunit n=1 Tax=Deinococcus koreensis TaxID=2054903 RepID=A0A2K3UYU9_9DEIO|nr:nitrite reductase small subunit NirD [Deinococcus koreensis]PNY81695.1 nitrite reductase (NAD(P)H) small subunit [Deinococcus koreensis]
MTLTPTRQPHDPALHWERVCALNDILPGLGVCALVGGEQVAVFHVAGQLFAVGNRDPFTGVGVISRGLTGSYTRAGETRLKVASPLLRHAFDLESGEYVGDPAVKLPTYPVRVQGGEVWIGSAV